MPTINNLIKQAAQLDQSGEYEKADDLLGFIRSAQSRNTFTSENSGGADIPLMGAMGDPATQLWDNNVGNNFFGAYRGNNGLNSALVAPHYKGTGDYWGDMTRYQNENDNFKQLSQGVWGDYQQQLASYHAEQARAYYQSQGASPAQAEAEAKKVYDSMMQQDSDPFGGGGPGGPSGAFGGYDWNKGVEPALPPTNVPLPYERTPMLP